MGLSIGTEHSAGLDIHCDLVEGKIVIPAGEWRLIPTGIAFELPKGWEAQIRSRSGLALKKGVAVLNSPGTIDEDYRGEIGVILINHGRYDYDVLDGDKVAQVVFSKWARPEFALVDQLSITSRMDRGFGSTGVHKDEISA